MTRTSMDRHPIDYATLLKEAVADHRRSLAKIEEAITGLGVPNEPANPARACLGFLAIEHLKLIETLTQNGLLRSDLGSVGRSAIPALSQLSSTGTSISGAAPFKKPFREIVLQVLNVLQVPSSPLTVTQVASAVYGTIINPSRFASLRRDERNAFFRDPGSRPFWLVPALSTSDLSPIPRFVASSAWSIEDRLVSEKTPQAVQLRALVALCNFLLTERGQPLQARLRPILFRLCPLEHFSKETEPTVLAIRDDALGVLESISIPDSEERGRAAERLRRLPLDQQLWGVSSAHSFQFTQQPSGRFQSELPTRDPE